jgi:hypothetical protein
VIDSSLLSLCLKGNCALSARHKLNAAHATGAVIVSGLIGACADSWTVFSIALAVLIVAAFHTGDIRSDGRDRRW